MTRRLALLAEYVSLRLHWAARLLHHWAIYHGLSVYPQWPISTKEKQREWQKIKDTKLSEADYARIDAMYMCALPQSDHTDTHSRTIEEIDFDRWLLREANRLK